MRPDITHSNYMQKRRKHVSCQMEETRQISNYPPLLLLVYSQAQIGVTDGDRDPEGCLSTQALSGREHPYPKPETSCVPPTKLTVLLSQLSYIGELLLANG